MIKARLGICICLLLLLFCGTAVIGQHPGDRQTHRLSLPNRNWSLDVSLEGFTVISEEVKDSGTIYFSAGQFPDKKSQPQRIVNLGILMEPAQLRGTAADLRALTMKKMKKNDVVDKGSLDTSEYGQIPLLRYVTDLAGIGIDSLNGDPLRGKGLKAFFVKDDVWITVGLAAGKFKEDDEQLFYSILDSVKIVDNSTPSSSFDYYQRGRSFFLRGEYREAIEPLSAALKLEEQKAQLTKADWRNLVLQLANAYGATGNKLGFDSVLEYGLKNDPNYYRFHFTRARMYSSEGRLDETIASLEKAFQYQQNETLAIRVVERLPDPLFDPAFERFRKDDKFRKAVKAMKKVTRP